MPVPRSVSYVYSFFETHAPLVSFQLCHVLEEYKQGEHVKKEFSGRKYSDYYNTLLENLKVFPDSKTFGQDFQTIREDIFETGR